MNISRICAIFEKDLKDFMRNTSLLFMPLLPIILAILYSRMGESEEMPIMMSYLVVGTVFTAVSTGCLMIMMAEEKEKKTLRGLIQSPASFIDIIIGKSLVTTLLTVISLFISLLLLGIEPFLNVKAIIALFFTFIFFLLLGIGIGLFVKTVAMTTAYMMPILFLFGFTPFVDFLNLDKGSIVLKIAYAFPIPQLIRLDETGSWRHVGVVALWMLGAALFAYICFIRTRKDD